MDVLVLNLAGALQSWGSESRFTERKTQHEPTKSGIVGLLAASLGRSRDESIDDLAALPMAVRIDQLGHYERDFQTAHTRKYDSATKRWIDAGSLPLSNRYYVSDAVFVVGIAAPGDVRSILEHSLTHPAFPLYLGRRSCPPAEKIVLCSFENTDLVPAMAQVPWQASDRRLRYRYKGHSRVTCEILRDVLDQDDESISYESIHDYPVSFSQVRRSYKWRSVIREYVSVPNPWHSIDHGQTHNPLSLFEEVV